MRYSLLLNLDQGAESCVIRVKSVVCHYLLFFTVLAIQMLILWTSFLPRLALFVIWNSFASVFHISCFLLMDDGYIAKTDFVQIVSYIHRTSLPANYSTSYSFLEISYCFILIQT